MKLKKKFLLILLILAALIAATFILISCNPKIKDENAIKKDLIGQPVNLTGKVESALLGPNSLVITDVKELEIIKRQTTEKNKVDFVHVNTTLVSDIAILQLELELRYSLYDNKGWVLEYVRSSTKPIITPNNEISINDIKPLYNQLFEEGEGKITKAEETENGTKVSFDITIKRDGYTAIYNGNALMKFEYMGNSERPFMWIDTDKNLEDPEVIFDNPFEITPEKLKEDATSSNSPFGFSLFTLKDDEVKSINVNQEDARPFLSLSGQVGVEIPNVHIVLTNGEVKNMIATYYYNNGNFYFDNLSETLN